MPEFYLGLISGTSRDGVEVVLAFPGGPRGWAVRAHRHFAYPEDVARDLERLTLAGAATYAELGQLDARIGEVFAEAALTLLRQASIAPGQVSAIGSHGQTIFHAPAANPPFTWQIGDPFRIAERTGIDTVAMFRQRDVAAGGEGAPLACGLHAACFSDSTVARAVVNIGGISNITWLRPGQPVVGYDCGPGNTLLDAWIRRHRDQPYDAEGHWAASGHCQPRLLENMRADSFFALPAPKSTGPEHFSPSWLDERLAATAGPKPAPEDVQATLAELTAGTIADAVERDRPTAGVTEVLICGGGVRNRDLTRRLQARLGDTPVIATDAFGLPAEQVEAAAFAWLAYRTLRAQAGNLPEVTGAAGPRILGCIIPGGQPAATRPEPGTL